MTSSDRRAGQEIALPQPAYTPSLLMQGVVTELARRDPKTSRVILLRAIPQRKRAETYGGYAFITLRDSQNTTAIDGKISKGLVERLEWGREHLFSGIVQYDRFNDRVTVQFLIGAIEGTGAARQPSKEDLLARWQEVIDRPRPDRKGHSCESGRASRSSPPPRRSRWMTSAHRCGRWRPTSNSPCTTWR